MQPIHIFTFKGIPVLLSPFFLLLIVLLSVGMHSLMASVCFGICAFFGVLFHEFGHALVAKHYGLNPTIVLQGLGGVTAHAHAPSEKQECLITLAGPLAGLVIGGLFFGLTFVLPAISAILNAAPFVTLLITYTAFVNLAWGIFNLIPIIPMDGSKVLNYLFRKCTKPQNAAKISALISVLLLTGVLAFSLLHKNVFMIILSMFFIAINYTAVKSAFSNRSEPKGLDRTHLIAEQAYERGLVAARDHDWKALRVAGNQMKKNAQDPEQRCRAYELLTIAATNECAYQEALEYAQLARQTDSVKRAVARCKAHLQMPD